MPLYRTPKLDDLAAPDDNTDLNVSTTAHGLTPKLSNTSTEYLSGTGVYSTPAGGSALPIAPQAEYGYLDAASQNATGSTLVLVADTLYYDPPQLILSARRITAVRMDFSAGVNPSTVRIGLVRYDSDGQPLSLLADFGTVTSNGAGTQAITGLTLDITEPMWVGPVFISAAGPTSRAIPVANTTFGAGTVFTHSRGVSSVPSVGAQHTALSNPPPDWTAFASESAGARRHVQFKWTVTP